MLFASRCTLAVTLVTLGATLGCSSASETTPAGGTLVTLPSDSTEGATLLVAGGRLYWGGVRSVASVAIDGGQVVPFPASPPAPAPFAIGGANLFYVDGSQHVGYAVSRSPLAGGPSTTLATGPVKAGFALAADASDVYWSAGDSVFGVPAAGGSKVTLASGHGEAVIGISLDATNVYWLDAGTREADTTLLAVPRTGGTVTTLATHLSEPTNVVSDGTDVYWGDSYSGAIVRVPRAGGAPTTLYTDMTAQAYGDQTQTSDVYFGGITVDDTSVYWTNTVASRNVMKVAKTGGTAVTLAAGLPAPQAIAVDSTSLYWTTNGPLMRLTPK
jgi:hypothetical protein